jgi:hypothetical protein
MPLSLWRGALRHPVRRGPDGGRKGGAKGVVLSASAGIGGDYLIVNSDKTACWSVARLGQPQTMASQHLDVLALGLSRPKARP